MKGKLHFKHLTISIIALLFALNVALAGGFTSYAAGGSFSNYWLSSNGGVKASYNGNTEVLTISGAGAVDYDRWAAMAQKINPSYFASVISWDKKHKEDAMQIVFDGKPKAIKLPGTEKEGNGLFTNFSGKIRFNNAVDLAPDVTDTSYMFAYARHFNEPVAFDTSKVTNMYSMFMHADNFNQPVNFDSRNVTNMSEMFFHAGNFNQSVTLDTSNVKNMNLMFAYAIHFNQPLNFDTGKVTDMSEMFEGAKSFNQPVNFDTSQVTNMYRMLSGVDHFNQPVNFDTSNVTNMSDMFYGADNFNQPVNFDTSQVTNMSDMFLQADSFNQPVNFDTRNVTDMSSMFNQATRFNQPVNFDTRNVTDMSGMFRETTRFNQPVDFDTRKVTNMYGMFWDAKAFNYPIFFDISSLDDMGYAFSDSAVEQVILSNYNNNKNIDARGAFENCNKLYYLSFSGLKDASITGFSGDYYVEQNGANGTLTPRHDYQGFRFDENKRYRVFLKSASSDYSDFKLSADGGVKANYQSPQKKLRISGAGDIEYSGWAAMAQKINPSYFASVISWDKERKENAMQIVFDGKPKAIKLPGTEKKGNGLFAGFSGKILFNNAVDLAPDVTDTSYMFYYTPQFNGPVNFDTSNVTNMSNMFYGALDFKQPVNFDTRNVTNMSGMFCAAKRFNQPVNFDTHNVTDMSYMFLSAEWFNQPVNFDTSNVTNMSGMFNHAQWFDQPVNFDTSKVTDMSDMFYAAKRFNQPVNFDTSQVTNMHYMFHGAKSFNQPVNFDTSNVTNMSDMFSGAQSFNQPVNFDTSEVTNMCGMFEYASAFNQPVNFDTSNVTNMSYMFAGAHKFNQPVNFDTSNVTNMSGMFRDAKRFKQPINFDISSADSIEHMFANSVVEYINLKNSANNKNIYAYGAFTNCKHLKELSFSGLKNAKIDGFFGDYYVSRNGSRPTAHNATEPYKFTDNQSYRVSLRSSIKPIVIASKQGDRVVVIWTPVTDATGYEVYGAFDKAGPFRLISTTRNTSQTYYASDNPFYQRQYLGELPCYYKVRAFIKNRDIELYGPFSEVTVCLRGIQPIDLNDRLGR